MNKLLLLPFLFVFLQSFSQYGVLDGDFDADGLLLLDPAATDYGQEIVVQPDGKILLAGYGPFGVNSLDYYCYRLFPDGSLDPSFGNNGLAVIDINGGVNECYAMVLQPDGKILLGGAIHNTATGFCVVRLNANGTLDGSFGNGGAAIVAFGDGPDFAYDLALQADGKIVAAGITAGGLDLDIALLRLNTNGTLDTSFSFDGKVITSIADDDWAQGVAVSANGKITVAGSAQDTFNGTSTALIRYNADGTLDNSFGVNGVVETDFSDGVDEFHELTLSDNGEIIAVGASWNGSSTDMLVARFLADGSPDNSFSFDGFVESDFNGGTDRAWSVLIQPDNKILVGGKATFGAERLALIRYAWDGSLDNTFGTNGKVNTQVGTNDELISIALQPDGKIVGGGTVTDGDKDLVVARYTSGIVVGMDELHSEEGRTMVYPNPVTGTSLTVDYVINPSEQATFDLYSATGQFIGRLNPSQLEANTQGQLTLHLPTLAEGSYILCLSTVDGVVYATFIVVR
jgi:uncharacterized delta-60 repeat protein